jgi:hypothetical protein
MKDFLWYTVAIDWTIYNKKWQKIQPRINEQWYVIVKLAGKNYRVHRIVAYLFIGPCRPWYQVNHIDGNKLNNHRDNLEYLSKSKNQLHRRHSLQKHWSTRSLQILAKKDGEVTTYSSINLAHTSLCISYTCIKQCCEGIRKTAGWYIFSYVWQT